jgi:hypothetical protein
MNFENVFLVDAVLSAADIVEDETDFIRCIGDDFPLQEGVVPLEDLL